MAEQLVVRWVLGLRRVERRAERFPWLEWLVEYSLATAFSFVAAVVGPGKRLPRLEWPVEQSLATAFSFVAAVVVPHLGGQFEDRAERGWQSR